MAIEVRISRGYGWRMIIIGAVCLVLGVWGLYDYIVDIPRRERLNEQRDVMELCLTALETEQAPGALSPEARTAVEAVDGELEALLSEGLGSRVDEVLSSIQEGGEAPTGALVVETSQENLDWITLLRQVRRGLVSQRELPLSEDLYPAAHAAYQAAQAKIDDIGEITTPGKYDRVTQWAFILCLPCVPYCFWMYAAARRRVYRLDDDGSLHMPEGSWKAEQIKDIDMDRWMAKSIAWVVHTDGTRVKLDDYKFRNLHLIVGALASRFHPQDWDGEARPIDKEAGAAEETPDEAPAESAAG